VLPSRTPRTFEPTDLNNPALYINRELSWLDFNQRVLTQATTAAHPLLERVKFLAIVGTNLDEFFMIRVATTLKKLSDEIENVAVDGYNTEQQLHAMRARATEQLDAQAACWNELRELLAAQHIDFLEPDTWTPQVREYLASYFSRDVCPVLTPLAFDPGHPFPLISNLSKNFAVVIRHGNRTKFARVKVPDVLPRFVPIPEALSGKPGSTFAFIEDVIRANMRAVTHLQAVGQVEGEAVDRRHVGATVRLLVENGVGDLPGRLEQGVPQVFGVAPGGEGGVVAQQLVGGALALPLQEIRQHHRTGGEGEAEQQQDQRPAEAGTGGHGSPGSG